MWSGFEEDRERDARLNTPGDDAFGCPMWCDTDFTPEGSEELWKKKIGKRIENLGTPPLIVFTGGEPLLQLDERLLLDLHSRFKDTTIAVETNGTRSLEETFGEVDHTLPTTPDWVCCSPKLPEDQLEIEACDEVKLIVPDFTPENYWSLEEKCRRRHTPQGLEKHLYVQPEDGPRFESACEQARGIVQGREGWRISTQSHKTIGAA